MDVLEDIVKYLKIIGVSMAGMTFIVLMIKIATEPEMKAKYIRLTKHLLIATILITVSLTIVEIPKHYYGDKVEIIDARIEEPIVIDLTDKDIDGREVVQVDGKWYVVTDRGWILEKPYGSDTLPMRRMFIIIEVVPIPQTVKVDVLKPFSNCQGKTKGFFENPAYYRDADGFIFPSGFSYSGYINSKNNSNNGGGENNDG